MCARQASGAVVCFSLGGVPVRLGPVRKVAGLADAADISCGGYHCCARRMSGGAACWGSEEMRGDGSASYVVAPVAVKL